MSYESAKYIYPRSKQWPVFSGGYVDNSPNTDLADNLSPFGRNFRLAGMSVTNRPWYVLLADVGGTSHPEWIGTYLRPTEADTLIVKTSDPTQSLVLVDQEGVVTDVSTSVAYLETHDGTQKFWETNLTTKVYKIAQGFLSYAGSVAQAQIYKKPNTGTFTGSVTVSIQADSAWSPSGVDLTSVVVSNATWNALSTWWHTLTFSSPYTTAANAYWLVLTPSTADDSNHPNIAYSTTGGYNVSYPMKRYNVIDGWVTITPPAQMSFRIIGDENTITWSERMSFTNIGDSVYTFNGDSMGKVQDTIYSDTYSDSWLTEIPRFSVFFGGCQWVGGFDGDNSNKIYKSPANDYADFSGTDSRNYSFYENVVGMITAQLSLFVFTKNTINMTSVTDQALDTDDLLQYNFRNLQTTDGAACNASIVSVGANVFYLTSSNKINRIVPGWNVNGFEVIELTERAYNGIPNLMHSLDTDQSESFAQYYPEQALIKWHLKSSGSAINDVCIVYDVSKDMFLVDTAKYFYDGTYLNGQVYTISMVDTTVFKDEWGTDDDGGAISFDYWTKWFDEGEFTLKKCYWESRTDVMMNPLAELTQEIYLNNYINVFGEYTGTLVDTKTVDVDNLNLIGGGIGTEATGSFPIGTEWSNSITMYPCTILRTKGNLNTKWYSIAFRYSCAVVGASVCLLRLWYKVEILPGLATPLTQ